MFLCKNDLEHRQVHKIDKYFLRMFNVARYQYWEDFGNFDITKNYQEQLQEMVKLKHDPYCGALLSKFYDWYNKNYISLESMNELWLAFVMKKRWNKIWTGEKWVKAE